MIAVVIWSNSASSESETNKTFTFFTQIIPPSPIFIYLKYSPLRIIVNQNLRNYILETVAKVLFLQNVYFHLNGFDHFLVKDDFIILFLDLFPLTPTLIWKLLFYLERTSGYLVLICRGSFSLETFSFSFAENRL